MAFFLTINTAGKIKDDAVHAFIAGFSLGLSLIFAIGAQNALVLKQGLKKQHVFLVCMICALSDAILISLGVSGFGVIVEQLPMVEQIARYVGALFLFAYALKSFYSSYHYSHVLNPAGEGCSSVNGNALKVALTCLAFTWLNPHVYLDTVVLLGSISTQYSDNKLGFTIGAVTASFTFFFALGYGARLLRPIFERASAWKIFEIIVGFLMLLLACSLMAGA